MSSHHSSLKLRACLLRVSGSTLEGGCNTKNVVPGKISIKGSLGCHDKMIEFQFRRKASSRIRTSKEQILGCLGNY